MNPRVLLEQSDFFRMMSPVIKDKVADISKIIHAEKKQVLFYENNPGHSIYINGTASVQLYKTSGDGKPIVIRIVGKAELFGEVVLFEQQTYPVNAEILQTGLLLEIPKHSFLKLLDESAFSHMFITDILKKLRYLADKIQSLTIHDVEQRFFIFLREHYGKNECIKMNYTKKMISEAIGTTPETFSRMIFRLKQNNILKWEDDTILLVKNFWNSWPKIE